MNSGVVCVAVCIVLVDVATIGTLGNFKCNQQYLLVSIVSFGILASLLVRVFIVLVLLFVYRPGLGSAKMKLIDKVIILPLLCFISAEEN